LKIFLPLIFEHPLWVGIFASCLRKVEPRKEEKADDNQIVTSLHFYINQKCAPGHFKNHLTLGSKKPLSLKRYVFL